MQSDPCRNEEEIPFLHLAPWLLSIGFEEFRFNVKKTDPFTPDQIIDPGFDKMLESAILLLAISLPIASCTHLYKYYYYETAVVPINAGRIEATLKGSWKKVSQNPEITENSSPYYLVIKVFIEGAQGIPVTLTSLNLDIKSRRKLILDDPEEEHTRQTIETEPPFTAYVFTGLELPEHEPVTITGHIYFGNDEASFSTTINPDYQEEKRNNIYDGIMGI